MPLTFTPQTVEFPRPDLLQELNRGTPMRTTQVSEVAPRVNVSRAGNTTEPLNSRFRALFNDSVRKGERNTIMQGLREGVAKLRQTTSASGKPLNPTARGMVKSAGASALGGAAARLNAYATTAALAYWLGQQANDNTELLDAIEDLQRPGGAVRAAKKAGLPIPAPEHTPDTTPVRKQNPDAVEPETVFGPRTKPTEFDEGALEESLFVGRRQAEKNRAKAKAAARSKADSRY